MRRRLLLLVTGTVAALTIGGIGTAHAQTDVPDVRPVGVSSGNWACVSLNDLHIGACVGNPYPDL